jgi:hypothetical protein
MYKSTKKAIVLFSIFFAITYLLGVLITGSFAVSSWDKGAKISAALVWVVGLFLISVGVDALDDLY